MSRKELLKQFDAVFSPEATYVRMFEQFELSERIIILLLAAKVRMFPYSSDTQLRLLVGFMRRFMNNVANTKLLEFWLSIIPYIEVGITKQNAIFIEHRIESLFLSLESDEYNEDVLITAYVVFCILFRKPSFTKFLNTTFCAKSYELISQHYDVTEGSDFLHLFVGNFFIQLRKDPMTASCSSYSILPTVACAIYHFTERYLRHIWDPTEMCEEPAYIEAVEELIDTISYKPVIGVSSLESCR